MSNFIDRCLILMAQQSISQKDLAEKIDKPYRSVNNWFNNRDLTPKTSDAVNIARALNTTVEFLETGIDSRYNELELNHRRFQKFVDLASEEQLGAMWNLIVAMQKAADYLKLIGT